MISLLLQEMGLSCCSFYKDNECVKIPQNLQPAFIIIDCAMRGDEKQSITLNVDQKPAIPVIFLSAYFLSELDFCLEGHHVFLEKPFSLKDFLCSVKALVALSEK
jgi:CheY-like chemotaxis protein